MHHLYHIHHKKDFGNYSVGYIGVTNNPARRYKEHLDSVRRGSKYTIHNAMRKYSNLVFTVICVGDEKSIYSLEEALRPLPKMGWNMVSGGNPPRGATKGKKRPSITGKSNYQHKGTYVTPYGNFTSRSQMKGLPIPPTSIWRYCSNPDKIVKHPSKLYKKGVTTTYRELGFYII